MKIKKTSERKRGCRYVDTACVCAHNIIIRRITREKNMKNDSYEFNVANARRDVVISAPLTFITFPEIK